MKVIPIQLTQVSQVRDFVNLTVQYPFDIEGAIRWLPNLCLGSTAWI